jgi:mannosyltransferase OCH1-like enzyme
MNIPKNILQTWKNYDIPIQWKESPASLQKLMPDWKYHLLSDTDNREFVKSYFPDFLQYYDSFPYNIQRADAIRYMWLYINGGMYMDLDIVLTKSIEDLIQDDKDIYFVKSAYHNDFYTNSIIISKPRHPFWLDVIEEMKKNISKIKSFTKHFHVLYSTGPNMLTGVIKNKYQVNNFGILPNKKFFPWDVCTSSYCSNLSDLDIYAYPLEGKTWNTFSSKFFNFFYCFWKPLIILLIMFLIVLAFLIQSYL